MSGYKALGAAAVTCVLLVSVFCRASPSAPAAALERSSHRTQETHYRDAPRAQNVNARGDAFSWKDQRQAAWDVHEQQGLDPVIYLPLVLKNHPLPPAWSGNARFGFGVDRDPVEQYNVSLLHADWYASFGFRSDPPPLSDLEFAQTIRLCEPIEDPQVCYPFSLPRTCTSAYSPDQASIVDYAGRHPGTLWLIGNEPDAPAQDCITPGRYAELYHDLYGIIKEADASAKVAIGGVVQFTPLREEYLDAILDAYADLYPEEGMIPVDVWNVHGFILPEEETGVGAGIPPGGSPDLAVYPNVTDHDNMTIFRQQIRDFRQWMKDRGERNKPLVVTEYGILYPISLGFDEPRVERFMLATFDHFLTDTSSSTGYPDDGYRLVQAWCWYSLNDSHFEGFETYSHLFDQDTKEITPLGIAYGNYTASLP